MELFPELANPHPEFAPLAYQLSPKSLDEFVGQTHLIGPDKPLRRMIEQDQLVSMLLWGPPGCGKTSLSRLISQITSARYIALNAVTARISDIKEAVEQARYARQNHQRTIIFVDEIHRFNKTQQDALLPDVENGLLTLIGATTENPFFSVIPALVSRSQIFELKTLQTADLAILARRAVEKKSHPDLQHVWTDDGIARIAQLAAGDARRVFNVVEMACLSLPKGTVIDGAALENLTLTPGAGYSEDDHYNFASALIKSIRGSDPDAAVYWLARMLAGGEQPEFIARRLIVLASEDVGNADPMGLLMATALLDAVRFIGMPEIRINLAQVVTYLACAPKSNAAYLAIDKAMHLIENGTLYPVPDYLKDAHYPGARKLGYGKGYTYAHDCPDGISTQPGITPPLTLYEPKPIGYEKQLVSRLHIIRNRRGCA